MAIYENRIQGRLDQRWSTWFDRLTISYEGDDITVLHGWWLMKLPSMEY